VVIIMSKINKRIHHFPVGYYDLHPDASINFQMNRFFNWSNDLEMLNEMREVAPKIHTYDEYVKAFLQLAQKSLRLGKKLNAAYYLRGAEFYMPAADPSKQSTRKQFISLAREYYEIDESQYYKIPYENAYLPAYRFSPPVSKGTIVIFGGFDSYIEEFFSFCFAFENAGYEVVCFEGPGQGGALEDGKLPLTHQWEKPVKAVLDFFNLDNVTVLGLSLGGYFAIRAGAFEKRIKRVIADDICYDSSGALLSKLKPSLRGLFKALLLNGGASGINLIFKRLMNKDLMLKWAAMQGMHVTGTQSPYAFLRKMQRCNTIDISSLLTQDVLLLAGQEDHYIPLYQLTEQTKALTNVRSLTTRMFTRKENAQNHCHVGNIQLAMNVMLNWMEQLQE
jgi:pimeloyl-ACP methyl ester carboxylesterase